MTGNTAWLGVMDLEGRLVANLCPLNVDEVDIVSSGVHHTEDAGVSWGITPTLKVVRTPRMPWSTRLDDETRYSRLQGKATSSSVGRRVSRCGA